jgi:hypothetical protein
MAQTSYHVLPHSGVEGELQRLLGRLLGSFSEEVSQMESPNPVDPCMLKRSVALFHAGRARCAGRYPGAGRPHA